MAMLGLPKLRKPISAFLYSRLLTWEDAIEEGLNSPRSFNSVSTVRNRPSGDPNCELFPQGAIIPVPPSTPPYRPVGAYGNNRAVFPGRNAKRKPPNQRVRRLLFPSFRWQLCSMAMPKQHQAVLSSTKNTSSEASSRYSHSIVKSSLQFAPVCRSSFYLHLVSKNAANPWGQIWVTDFGAGQGAFVGHGGSRKPFLVFESRQEDKCGQSLLAFNHELLRCRVVLLVEVNRGLLVLLVIGAPPKECSSRWDSCVAWNRGDFGRRNPFIQRVSANRAVYTTPL